MKKYEDKGFKIISLYLLNGLLEIIGIDVEIKEFLSPYYVNLNKLALELDLIFLGTDGIIYHIEFQSKMPSKKDLARFFQYDAEVRKVYPDTEIRSYILLTANINSKLAKSPLYILKDITPEYIVLNQFNGDDILNNIKHKINNNINLTEKEQVQLVLIPFFKTSKKLSKQILNTSKLLVKTNKEYTEDLARLLMLFSEKFLNKEENYELIEVLKMRIESVEIYGDKREEKGIKKGIEKGIEKGKLETAKNMLNNGFSIEDVSICTNLTIEQINNL